MLTFKTVSLARPGDKVGDDGEYLDPLTVKYRDVVEASNMITSNPKLEGKLQFTPAPDGAEVGETNSGSWFKKIGSPLVSSRYFLDMYTISD